MKTILQHYLDKFKTAGNTISDISFDNLPFLNAKEPIYDMKGQKVSKSYFDKTGRETIRIRYHKIHASHQGVDNVFVGLKKSIQYFDWAGEIYYTKYLQPYYFRLEPIYDLNDSSIITGYSSPKMRSILKKERFNADDFLQSKNPELYALLYSSYSSQYEYYLKTGVKTGLVNSIEAETSNEIINALSRNVIGSNPPITVKELILMNLQ